MTDIFTTANELAARLGGRTSEESTTADSSAADSRSTDSSASPLKRYAKRAAVLGALALGRRFLSEDRTENAVDNADATRVDVRAPDETPADEDESQSESESEPEESGGGILSLKRVLLVGALAGAGYLVVRKLRSKSDQHTLEEWDEREDESGPPTHVEVATGDEAAATGDVETTAAGPRDTPVPDAEKGQQMAEVDDDDTVEVDIGADTDADSDTEDTGVATDTDESVDATDAGNEAEDEDEDERVNQNE